MPESFFQIDAGVLLWIQENIRTPVLTDIFKFVTHLGDYGRIWILMGVLLLVPKKTRKAGITVLISMLLSYLINNCLLKNLFCRTRPYEVVEGLQRLIEKQHDYSFPSGHTASSFAAAWAVFLNVPRRYGVWPLILAALISFSRLYLGVHFPTDVLGGICSAIAISSICTWAVNQMKQRIRALPR